MGYQRRRRCESDIYHVMARGVGRLLIFEDDADRGKYLGALESALARHNVGLLAWCLMDNHIHLLFHGCLDDIAKVMQNTGRTYALHFNKRHDRVGHLFQGRFVSAPIEGDSHLLTVVRYIHQNPSEGGLSKTCDYPWSSYGAYLGAPNWPMAHMELDVVLDLFDGDVDGFKRFHEVSGSSLGRSGMQVVGSTMSIEAASAALRDVLAEQGLGEVPLHDKLGRNAILSKLRERGLSIRQIERVTGVGRGIIARA